MLKIDNDGSRAKNDNLELHVVIHYALKKEKEKGKEKEKEKGRGGSSNAMLLTMLIFVKGEGGTRKLVVKIVMKTVVIIRSRGFIKHKTSFSSRARIKSTQNSWCLLPAIPWVQRRIDHV